MKVQEQREIIEAYERGDEIKWKYYYEDSFEHVASKELCDEHQFDFVNRVYRIKKKRWRAEKGEWYYYLTLDLNVRENDDEYYFADSGRYNVGNYFRTMEDAEKARDLIKELLTKFHEEND